ncbi:hypothetical protein T484DRAFT_1800621 [Baffinella frigidus]|nr:hypothetical protein T484DRAFT_1800621 [Cryptophyta sp. CCMP2293]
MQVSGGGGVIEGPLSQGGYQVLLAQMPINIPGEKMTVGGEDCPCWGFVGVLLNWEQLLEEVGLHSHFSDEGMQFTLTRMENVTAGDGSIEEKVRPVSTSLGMLFTLARMGNVTAGDGEHR